MKTCVEMITCPTKHLESSSYLHTLFKDAPKALVEKIEQVVRLIRSKGVSVWFITQNPMDIPESVLGQIGSRVQHALRAYTPNDQKNLRAAARSFRVNPNFDTEEALQSIGTGEALVSVLDEKGIPSIVQKAGILPPRSAMDMTSDAECRQIILQSPLYGKYEEEEDRKSAFEMLEELYADRQAQQEAEARQLEWEKEQERREKEWERKLAQSRKPTTRKKTTSSSRKKANPLEKAVNSAANTVGREIGKRIVRGLFGNAKW